MISDLLGFHKGKFVNSVQKCIIYYNTIRVMPDLYIIKCLLNDFYERKLNSYTVLGRVVVHALISGFCKHSFQKPIVFKN